MKKEGFSFIAIENYFKVSKTSNVSLPNEPDWDSRKRWKLGITRVVTNRSRFSLRVFSKFPKEAALIHAPDKRLLRTPRLVKRLVVILQCWNEISRVKV